MHQSIRSFQCRCGRLHGRLSESVRLTHLACHCRDCQTYAHALGAGALVLDQFGGTDVITTLQHHVTFTKGKDQLACLSLSEQGLLRWYAKCCDTPIANTARDPKMSYVALLHTSLGSYGDALAAKLGTVRIPINPEYAKAELNYSPINALLATARIVRGVLLARLKGSWKLSPFFRPGTSEPVVAPRVLSVAERNRAASPVDATTA